MNKLTVTFDECDIDQHALSHARRQAFRALLAKGVTDLNALSAADWDYYAFVLVLTYNNKLAERNHGFSAINWGLRYKDVDVPI